MSDNIPFDIQIYIMKRLPVKSILRFRTVSKEWKSCIDLINFQKTYGIRSSNDCCMILRYNQALPSYMLSLDHNLTYSPLVTVVNDSNLLPVGTCHGIWYFSYGILSICCSLWNPSIKRSINILVPTFNSQPKSDKILLGFGVRPDTLDPTIIKVSYPRGGHGNWYVSVFTLRSMDRKKLDNDCFPRESIIFKRSSQVVVGRLIFWAGHERFVSDDGHVVFKKHLVVSFDLIGHSFQVHDIDDVFRDGLTVPMCLSSIVNSLILFGSTNETDCYLFCGWSVLVDVTSLTSFTKLFAIPTPNYVKLLGFTMDETSLPIVEVPGPHQLANSHSFCKLVKVAGTLFWTTAKVKTVNRERQIQALVDKKKVIITKTSIRSDLKLDDAEGTECLPNDVIFEQLTLMGYENLTQKLTFYKAYFSPQWKFLIHTILQCLSAKKTAWNEFSNTMAYAIICLATNQDFNFSKYIFDNMIKNLEGGVKFIMYSRFVQVFLDKQVEGMSKHNGIYVISSHTKKVFANMKREGKGFSGRVTHLFQSIMVQASEDIGEDSAAPTDSHSTLIITQPSSSKPQKKKSRRKKGRTLVLQSLSLRLLIRNMSLPLPMIHLKVERIKKLEKKRRSKIYKSKRLYKVGSSRRVESSEESLGAQEDAFNQGRKIAAIDQDT
ncbi:ribonuclease H-like domain-containing protein [Tanacetum coccineum]